MAAFICQYEEDSIQALPLLLPAPEPSLSDQFGSLAQAIGTVQQSLEKTEQQQGTETGQLLLGRKPSARSHQPRPAAKAPAKQSKSRQKAVLRKAIPAVPSAVQKELPPKVATAGHVDSVPTAGLLAQQSNEEPPLQVQQERLQGQGGIPKDPDTTIEVQAAVPSKSAAELGTRASEAPEVSKDDSAGPSSNVSQALAAQQTLEELRQRAVAAVKLRKAEAARGDSNKKSAPPQTGSETAQPQNSQEARLPMELAHGQANAHQQMQSQAQLPESAQPISEKDLLDGRATAGGAKENAANGQASARPARNFRQRKAASSVSGSLITSKPPEATASPQSKAPRAVAPGPVTQQPPSKKQRLNETPRGHLPMPPNYPMSNLLATAGTSSSSDKDSTLRSHKQTRRRSEKRERSPDRRRNRDGSQRSPYAPHLSYKERERQRERDRELRRRDESRRTARRRSPSPYRGRRSRSRRADTPEKERLSKRARSHSTRPSPAKAQRSARTSPGD